MFKTIDEIKSAHKGHWFDADTLSFFDSKVHYAVFPATDGAYFVSSERKDNGPRRYTVRKALANGKIETFGGFRAYRLLSTALLVAANASLS